MEVTPKGSERRSLKYICLAAWLADRPSSIDRFEISLVEIEGLVGASLPPNARFPSWWRNDRRRMHSRAWMTAGWEVERMDAQSATITFARAA